MSNIQLVGAVILMVISFHYLIKEFVHYQREKRVNLLIVLFSSVTFLCAISIIILKVVGAK